MSNSTVVRRAVILTALGLEYEAVQAHLSTLRREEGNDNTFYEIGIFATPLYTWEVCIAEIGTGNSEASIATQSAINHFNPDVAFFVGVAGGLKKNEIALGDVVCATKVYGYEYGKDTEDGFKVRPEIGNVTFRMVSFVRSESHRKDWQERIQQPLPASKPKVLVAPIAAGEKVVGPADIYNFLRDKFSDAVAVEMEGFGFLLAMHRKPEIDALVIRGISDLIFDKTTEQDEKWQPIAAQNASAFAFEILAKLPVKGQRTLQQIVEPTQSATTITPQGSGGNGTMSTTGSNESIQIFYSYVGKDQALIDELDTHLAVPKRRKWIVTSFAAEPGVNRMEQLNRADIILLFISPSFVNTPDIYEKEVKRAMERWNEGIRVIPVLLRPTDGWLLEEFGGLVPVPRDKPVSAYSNKDDAFSKVAGEIRAVVTNIRKERGLPE
jgi:nucleoside phosphorylase